MKRFLRLFGKKVKKESKLQYNVEYVFPGSQNNKNNNNPETENRLLIIIKQYNEISKKLDIIDNVKHLIVDDSESNRFIMSKYLEKLNINYDIASNGLEALEKISQNKYQIIWIDLKMPILNGLETTKILREFMNYNGTIIGVTGFSDPETTQICKKIGFDKVIGKPITIDLIRDLLEKKNT